MTRFCELVDGWLLTEPWPGAFHDRAAKVLERALKADRPFPFVFDLSRLSG